MRYEYADLDENERQYDHIDLSENPVVDAVYVKSSCMEDRGNPYIESLPRPKTMEEILSSYYNISLHLCADQYAAEQETDAD